MIWNTSEQEYQSWKNQGQCLINLGLLFFIQSSLCSDQNCGILRDLSLIRAVWNLLIRICPTKEEALMVPFLKRVKDNAYLWKEFTDTAEECISFGCCPRRGLPGWYITTKKKGYFLNTADRHWGLFVPFPLKWGIAPSEIRNRMRFCCFFRSAMSHHGYPWETTPEGWKLP